MLVETLFTQPTSLAIAALCGVLSAIIAAVETGEQLIEAGTVALTAIAIFRMITATGFTRNMPGMRVFHSETVYELGAWSYAACISFLATITIVLDVLPDVKLLMVCNALCYGCGIAARNAGRPAIAVGQLLAIIAPVSLALIFSGSLAQFFLGVTAILLFPAMFSICINVFGNLRRSIVAAETSRQLADRMQMLARTDVLTSLSNRAGLDFLLADLFDDHAPDKKLALLWIDLDRFKEVNDTLGHPVGDVVLREVAARLRDQAPADAIVSRFGGDEFVIAAEMSSLIECEELAGRIMEDISRPFRHKQERLDVGCSMGIALYPDDCDDVDSLMQSADLALYHAKVSGRRQASFFTQDMNRDLVKRREIEMELRGAIQRDELSVFYQPIVDLQTGRIRTFEALVRWFHPEKGELRPDEFIPVAEETGLIITIGNWITAQAAKACASWPEDISVAVNLSPLQIKANGAALGILNAIQQARLDPRRLELEVTEGLFIDDSEVAGKFIEELSSYGVRFAMDDFGTGYSSLGYINKFPFKKIKVDRSFVSGNEVGAKSEAILRAVAGMGSSLDLDIVAEGLETEEQVESVRSAGCTLGQGYYYSRAVPDYIATLLLKRDRDMHEKRQAAG